MRPPGSPQELERRRRRATALRRQRVPPVEITCRLGVDRRSVRRWVAACPAPGAHGPCANARRGQPLGGIWHTWLCDSLFRHFI